MSCVINAVSTPLSNLLDLSSVLRLNCERRRRALESNESWFEIPCGQVRERTLLRPRAHLLKMEGPHQNTERFASWIIICVSSQNSINVTFETVRRAMQSEAKPMQNSQQNQSLRKLSMRRRDSHQRTKRTVALSKQK